MKFEEIMDEIVRICKANNVEELYLFGSYATNTATPFSDIDIIVKGVSDIGALKEQLDKIKTLKKIDVFDYDHCKNEHLLEAMNKYGRKIYGTVL